MEGLSLARKGNTYYRDYLTKEDVSKILEASVPYETAHLFLRLLARTGRRMGEIKRITPRDVDIREKCLWTHIECSQTSVSLDTHIGLLHMRVSYKY